MELKGSKTEKNLMTAFAGESQARNKYTYFASKAKKDCSIKCCGEEMIELAPNSVDASFEKHVPNYEAIDNHIIVKVNHVMEEEHFIEWIAMLANNKIIKKFLLPNEKASAIFPYVKGSKIYSFCNKHGLWAKDIE